jgi:hypothetical protein
MNRIEYSKNTEVTITEVHYLIILSFHVWVLYVVLKCCIVYKRRVLPGQGH